MFIKDEESFLNYVDSEFAKTNEFINSPVYLHIPIKRRKPEVPVRTSNLEAERSDPLACLKGLFTRIVDDFGCRHRTLCTRPSRSLPPDHIRVLPFYYKRLRRERVWTHRTMHWMNFIFRILSVSWTFSASISRGFHRTISKACRTCRSSHGRDHFAELYKYSCVWTRLDLGMFFG